MAKKMLIDAAHPEETRVVVVQDKRVEDFDFESSTKDRNRGNIYLAKVTRIEPSLQAAFVDYGGNRHGFLAFNEIHPDYYQIPIADKEALLEAEAAAHRTADIETDAAVEAATTDEPSEEGEETEDASSEGDENLAAAVSDEENSEGSNEGNAEEAELAAPEEEQASEDGETPSTEEETLEASETADEGAEDETEGAASEDDEAEETPTETAEEVETLNSNSDDDEDVIAESQKVRRQKLRSYKIQEVIKRRQIILVQVVKEERGNKGAALTTYLSLAGRYCVLMPNTGRGGGISRKISNMADRKRLKKVVESLDVPTGIGLIIRTAGAKRTKTEIKRDYEYLLRLWENVRSLTLESIAPTLVYEEGSLIKRSIRDLYSKDIDEVWVEGEDAYKEAKAFMRMLTPSHSKNVKRYKDNSSLFQRYQVEPQLDDMFSPQVQLKSGGYLVINPTEALVSIDVNSGRATKERSIEKTALNTNLEAAEEVARQCRLRDLAGLLVIDFIDMEENRNNRAVERKLKESLKHDRARVQVGRISSFGLLEMSRQRMRSSVLEGTSTACTVCEGSGVVRSVESTTLRIIRAIEELALNGNHRRFTVRASVDTALYLLNNKRTQLQDVESRYDVSVIIDADKSMQGPQFELIRGASRPAPAQKSDSAVSLETPFSEDDEASNTEERSEEEVAERPKRRRRRRSRRGGDKDKAAAEAKNEQESSEEEASAKAAKSEGDDEKEGSEQPRRRRRRGKRGGRRHSKKRAENEANAEGEGETVNAEAEQPSEEKHDTPPPRDAKDDKKEDDGPSETVSQEAPSPEPSSPSRNGASLNGDTVEKPATDTALSFKPEKEKKEQQPALASIETESEEPAPAQPTAPPRRGWWQRRGS